MDIMDKIALGYAMLHVLVVTTLTGCVILDVIQNGRKTTLSNVRGYSIAYQKDKEIHLNYKIYNVKGLELHNKNFIEII